MTLVFDRTEALAGKAMTHVFLVGVSDYQHLPAEGEAPTPRSHGLRKLAAPALSAWDLCCWLVANASSLARPLGTIRLLLSASDLEQQAMQPEPVGDGWLGGEPELATFASFQNEAHAWRDSASVNPQNMTVFYFGGHGVDHFGATLLACADFAQPVGGMLSHCCRFANVIEGMAPHRTHRPNVARRQFYFVDTCRQDIDDPELLRSRSTDIWDPGDGVDDRATPAFMGSYPGAVALNTPGRRTDYMEALLTALEVAAEGEDADDPQERWPITSFTLDNALRRHFDAKETGQYAPATGVTFTNVTLRWLDQPPLISFKLLVRPDEKVEGTTIALRRVDGGFESTFPAIGLSHPYVVKARAGIFTLVANDGTARHEAAKQMNAQKPLWRIVMG